jgi:hypothetical protein
MGQSTAFGGLFMNVYVVFSCFFTRVTLLNERTGEPIEGSEEGYGFFAKEVDTGLQPDYKQCLYYPENEYDYIFDGWFHSARFFTSLSMFIGTVCFGVMVMASCCAFSANMFERWLLWSYIIAACVVMLSFLAFGSEFCNKNDCKVAQGSGYAISTFMFWLVCANTVKSMGAASDTPGEDDDSALGDEDDGELYYETEEAKYPKKRRLPEQGRYADDDDDEDDDDDDDDDDEEEEDDDDDEEDDEDDQRRSSSRKDKDEYEDEFEPNVGDADRTKAKRPIETTSNGAGAVYPDPFAEPAESPNGTSSASDKHDGIRNTNSAAGDPFTGARPSSQATAYDPFGSPPAQKEYHPSNARVGDDDGPTIT